MIGVRRPLAPTTFWPATHALENVSCWAVRPRLHERSVDAGDAEPGDAGVRSPPRLDDPLSGLRGELLAAVKREKRERLLEAARRREIDVVLIWRFDCWGRSVTDLLATLQELEHLGVGFASLTGAQDLTTPAGRPMAGMLAILAEFERELLRERTKAGLIHALLVRHTSGAAGHSSRALCCSSKTAPCRRQQIRNRPTVADRTYLRSANSGGTYFSGK